MHFRIYIEMEGYKSSWDLKFLFERRKRFCLESKMIFGRGFTEGERELYIARHSFYGVGMGVENGGDSEFVCVRFLRTENGEGSMTSEWYQ